MILIQSEKYFAATASGQDCWKLYSGISPDKSCERMDIIFKNKKQPVGAVSWRT